MDPSLSSKRIISLLLRKQAFALVSGGRLFLIMIYIYICIHI